MTTTNAKGRTPNAECRRTATGSRSARSPIRHPAVGVRHSTFACFVCACVLLAVVQAAAAEGDGGLAGLSPDDVTALREARDALERIVADEGHSDHLRRDAALGLSRIHEALNDWGRAGQLDWYLSLLARPQPGGLQAALAEGAQSAARAREPHFGSVRGFWRALDALAREKHISISDETERVRKQFGAVADHLSKLSWVSSPLSRFEVKIPPMDLHGLKPLPEAGKK